MTDKTLFRPAAPGIPKGQPDLQPASGLYRGPALNNWLAAGCQRQDWHKKGAKGKSWYRG